MVTTTRTRAGAHTPAAPAAATRDRIAHRWYEAVAATSFVPLPARGVRALFIGWTEELLGVLTADGNFQQRAGRIGRALADLHGAQPEALERTLAVLDRELRTRPPVAGAGRERRRVGAVLSALALGFTNALRDRILAEQERIRRAQLAELRALECAVQERDLRLRATFEGAPVGIILCDASGHLVEANAAMTRFLGYDAAALRRMALRDITHPDDVAESARLFDGLLAGARDRYQMEKRYVHQDGRVLWGRVSVSLIQGEGPREGLVVGMVEDITAAKRVEAELAETRRRLAAGREAERLKLARELHDGPIQDLYGVRYQLAPLADATVDPDDRVRLDHARAALHAVTATLRAVCGELRPPALSPFGLEAALRSYATRLQRAHSDLVVRFDMAPDARAVPEATGLALYRVGQEALRNAARHGGPCQVTVRLRARRQHVTLEVQDDGCGFSVPTNWVAFARRGHLGLLGMVERAEAIRGRLSIRSAVGAGTLVRLVAPSAAGCGAPETPAAVDGEGAE